MRTSIFLLLLSIGLACQAQSPAPLEENASASKSLGYKKVAEALSSLELKPNASVQKTQPGGWTIITFPEPEFAVWSFTPVGHYAHPAVIRRTVRQANGMIYIDMSAICENTKQSCDNLMREFQAMNNQTRNEVTESMLTNNQN